MSSNRIPLPYDGVCAVSLRLIGGLSTHEQTLGLKQTTAEVLRQTLEEAQNRQQAYQAVLGERPACQTPARQASDRDGRQFINAAKKVLRHHLGDQWNQSWSEAGFVDPSIATPDKLSGRETLLQALAAYFKAHPDQESADFGVTAERAAELHQSMSAAQNAVHDYSARRTMLKADRDKAVAALRKRLRGAVAELALLLERDSPLWSAFGLTAPARQNRSKKNLQAVASGTGSTKDESDISTTAAENNKVVSMAA
jgi:hypothetical protein